MPHDIPNPIPEPADIEVHEDGVPTVQGARTIIDHIKQTVPLLKQWAQGHAADGIDTHVAGLLSFLSQSRQPIARESTEEAAAGHPIDPLAWSQRRVDAVEQDLSTYLSNLSPEALSQLNEELASMMQSPAPAAEEQTIPLPMEREAAPATIDNDPAPASDAAPTERTVPRDPATRPDHTPTASIRPDTVPRLTGTQATRFAGLLRHRMAQGQRPTEQAPVTAPIRPIEQPPVTAPIRPIERQVRPVQQQQPEVRRERLSAQATGPQVREYYRYPQQGLASPQEYMNFLVRELDSPERINQFLMHCFEYRSDPLGSSITYTNTGAVQPNEEFVNGTTFATRCDSDGKRRGDCDDIGIFISEILLAQGKPAFCLDILSHQSGGHLLAGYFDNNGPGGSRRTHIIDTTGNDRTHAMLRTATARQGETDDQLFSRLYGQQEIPLNTEAVRTDFVTSDNRIFAIPCDLHFARTQSHALQGMLERRDYSGVLTVINQAVSRNQSSLSLRMAQIQFLILSGANRTQVEASVRALPANATVNPQNRYDLTTTYDLLLSQRPPMQAEARVLIARLSS